MSLNKWCGIGRMVKDPTNCKMVGIAAITGTAAQLLMGTIVDICKANQTPTTDIQQLIKKYMFTK